MNKMLIGMLGVIAGAGVMGMVMIRVMGVMADKLVGMHEREMEEVLGELGKMGEERGESGAVHIPLAQGEFFVNVCEDVVQ